MRREKQLQFLMLAILEWVVLRSTGHIFNGLRRRASMVLEVLIGKASTNIESKMVPSCECILYCPQ
jgi:hypothetical protein